MILDTREPLLTYEEVASILPQHRRTSKATWWRWTRRGVRGKRLECVKIGGRIYTTKQAFAQFAEVFGPEAVQ